MGIYIKKVLGYGLQLSSEEAFTTLDSDVIRKRYNMSAGSYKEFLQGKYGPNTDDMDYLTSDLAISDMWEDKYKASDFITVVDNEEQEETDDKMVWLVITPPLTCKEWKHNDDPIDYYEECLKYQNSEFQLDSNIKFFNHGLFPYEGNFVNHATGELVNSDSVRTLNFYLNAKKNASPEEDKALRLLLAGMKFSTVAEFKSFIHPAPPQSVVDIAEWSGIFKDTSLACTLRPALLTYWS